MPTTSTHTTGKTTNTPCGCNEVEPSKLETCDETPPPGCMCNSIRFNQVLLLGATNPSWSKGKILHGYHIMQPHRLAKELTGQDLDVDEAKEQLRTSLKRRMPVTSALEEGSLPQPGAKSASSHVMRSELCRFGFDVPSHDDELATAYRSFIDGQLREEIRTAAQPLRLAGRAIGELKSSNDLIEAMWELSFPGPIQALTSKGPHFAICAVYEQVWCHRGYTRGEQLATIGLAPGEELSLEVHTWVKDSFSSERELAIENELRFTNRLNSRDHLEVAAEMAMQGEFRFGEQLGLSLPIGKIPIGANISADLAAGLNQTVAQTVQNTTDATEETVNTLRSTRKTRIEEARETGRDEKQLRKVVNTNRCHTLNVRYFEVLSNYEVTIRLVDVVPSLLFPMQQPSVTPEWVLCHEHILKAVLLDKIFHEGFTAARTIEIHEHLADLETAGAVANVSGPSLAAVSGDAIESQLAPLRDGIISAFAGLRDTWEASEDDIESLGSLWTLPAAAWRLADKFPKVFYWGLLQLNSTGLYALEKLEASTNRPAIDALRDFFAVEPTFYANPAMNTLSDALDGLGVPEGVAQLLDALDWFTFATDDNGLGNAVTGAKNRLTGLLSAKTAVDTEAIAETTFDQAQSGGQYAPPGQYMSAMHLAEARVEFERLKCHIEHNKTHYFQAVWFRERASETLQSSDWTALVAPTPVAFVDGKVAYPLLDPTKAIGNVDFSSAIKASKNLIDSALSEPICVTLPTPGPIAEATVGACVGCEDYITESRTNDLRHRRALAQQEEAEASRRQARLDDKNLEPFDPCCSGNEPDDGDNNVKHGIRQ